MAWIESWYIYLKLRVFYLMHALHERVFLCRKHQFQVLRITLPLVAMRISEAPSAGLQMPETNASTAFRVRYLALIAVIAAGLPDLLVLVETSAESVSRHNS